LLYRIGHESVVIGVGEGGEILTMSAATNRSSGWRRFGFFLGLGGGTAGLYVGGGRETFFSFLVLPPSLVVFFLVDLLAIGIGPDFLESHFIAIGILPDRFWG
jgi:hypothetical protein